MKAMGHIYGDGFQAPLVPPSLIAVPGLWADCQSLKVQKRQTGDPVSHAWAVPRRLGTVGNGISMSALSPENSEYPGICPGWCLWSCSWIQVSCYWGVFLCLGRASVAAQGLLPVSRFCNHCLLCWLLKPGEGGSSSVYNSLAQQFPCTGVRFHGVCLWSPGDPICLIWAAVGGCVNLLQW